SATPTASSQPTTPPNAASAARSSTASSRSAPNPNEANAASNDSSPPRSPAGSASNRSSPTSPRPSPPTLAATRYPPSANSRDRLNAYRKESLSREETKPSDGLEPSTPSLPWRCSTN